MFDYIAFGKKQWEEIWSRPIPEPSDGTLPPIVVAHMLNSSLWLGLTKKEVKRGVRTWTLKKLHEFARRILKARQEVLDEAVQMVWDSLGQTDARIGRKFYRDVDPPEQIPFHRAQMGERIIWIDGYDRTRGPCTVTQRLEKGWIGTMDDGEIVTGEDLQILEVVLYDRFEK